MRIYKPLSRRFYEPSAKAVAPALLGHWLVRNTADGPCGGPIVETEAYLVGDPACHGAPGLTGRNRVMFGAPGHAYVYLIYGFYFCMNAVCRPPGVAEAVLIRAVEVALGEELMRKWRPVDATRDLTNGPGKLCLAMDIDRGLDGVDLCGAASPLFIARNPAVQKFRRGRGPMVTGRRIGLTKAADLALRYYLPGSLFVSQRRAERAEIRRPKTEGRNPKSEAGLSPMAPSLLGRLSIRTSDFGLISGFDLRVSDLGPSMS